MDKTGIENPSKSEVVGLCGGDEKKLNAKKKHFYFRCFCE